MLNRPYKTLSDGLKIFGNNHPVPIVYGWELTPKERKEFDYLSDDEMDGEAFFRYKGNVYSLDEFMRIEGAGTSELRSIADGIHNDTYFSGILVKYVDSNDAVLVYTFYSGV
jgi:hypothetical protein